MTKASVYVATQTFSIRVDGVSHVIHAGTTVRRGHRLLERASAMFAPVEDHVDFDVVEQATAAPGEKRQLPEPETKRGPGRPKLPRDAEGNIIRE